MQGALSVAVAVALTRLWRSAASYALKAAALCLSAILVTPYSFDYDMMVLAPAIAFSAVDGMARGFGAWEKTALAALWLVPLVARSVAQLTLIPLGVRRCSPYLFSYCAAAELISPFPRRAHQRRFLPIRLRDTTSPRSSNIDFTRRASAPCEDLGESFRRRFRRRRHVLGGTRRS